MKIYTSPDPFSSAPVSIPVTFPGRPAPDLAPPVSIGGVQIDGAKDIATELWREYDFEGRVYRIDNPVALHVGTTTHRVVGPGGIVHCVPAPGHHGCVLRWLSRDTSRPVEF